MLLRALVALPELNVDPPQPARRPLARRAQTVDLRGRGVQVATIARLAAAGEDVLVVVADRDRRRRMLRGPLSPQRFGGGTVALAEYGELDGIEGFAEAVALDPPVRRRVDAGAGDAGRRGAACTWCGAPPRSSSPARWPSCARRCARR